MPRSFQPISLVLVYFVVVASRIALVHGQDRLIKVQVNPGCTECGKADTNGSFNNLVYVKAIGLNDTIHMLYANIDAFTIMVFKTAEDANPTVNATQLLSHNASEMFNAIQFDKPVLEQFGYAFPVILEFNDTQGTADLKQVNDSQIVKHWTSQLVWKPFEQVSNTSGVFAASRLPGQNGTFKFVLRYAGQSMRDDQLPRLLLNPETVSVDFIIDSVDATFKDAKFALNVLFLTKHTQVSMDSKRTLDDEYTPATFKLFHVEVDDSANQTRNYFQWRPIFYYNEPKNVENATITKQYSLGKLNYQSEQTQLGIGSCFYPGNQTFSVMNVSFGIEGDEKNGYFYTQTNYSIWTFSLGPGRAPDEQMSSIVTIVIIVGFGLPAAVILFGLVFMIVKKIRQRGQYSEFQQL